MFSMNIVKTTMIFALSGFMFSAEASLTTDQSQLSFNGGVPFVFPVNNQGVIEEWPDYPVGQSFTAGISGKLHSINVLSNGILQNGENTLNLDIHAGDGTSGVLLGSSVVQTTHSDNSLLLSFNVSNLGIHLLAGSQYTFDFTSVSGAGDLALRGILGTYNDSYAGGHLYASGYLNNPEWDLSFETVVDSITSVPEPSAYLLFLMGIGCFAFKSLRQKNPIVV